MRCKVLRVVSDLCLHLVLWTSSLVQINVNRRFCTCSKSIYYPPSWRHQGWISNVPSGGVNIAQLQTTKRYQSFLWLLLYIFPPASDEVIKLLSRTFNSPQCQLIFVKKESPVSQDCQQTSKPQGIKKLRQVCNVSFCRYSFQSSVRTSGDKLTRKHPNSHFGDWATKTNLYEWWKESLTCAGRSDHPFHCCNQGAVFQSAGKKSHHPSSRLHCSHHHCVQE